MDALKNLTYAMAAGDIVEGICLSNALLADSFGMASPAEISECLEKAIATGVAIKKLKLSGKTTHNQ
jgi:hypothetical protein